METPLQWGGEEHVQNLVLKFERRSHYFAHVYDSPSLIPSTSFAFSYLIMVCRQTYDGG